jgi:PIN domain nuclease of toxin-antitoxin system
MILLDTHVLLWAIYNSDNLPNDILDMIQDTESVFFSVVSLWEIQLKHSIDSNFDFDCDEVKELAEKSGYIVLPVIPEHISALKRVKQKNGAPVHKDPFDRILLAQSLVQNAKLVTADHLLPYYEQEIVYFRKN